MKSTTVYALIGLGVIIMLGIAWYGFKAHAPLIPAMPEATTTSAVVPSDGSSIYASGTYGFTVAYPASATLEDPFKTYYHLPNYWRASALTDATGTPIVAIVGYRSQSDHTYPRYFDAEVRIGVSSDEREVKGCLVARADQAEVALPDVTLGGTVFKAFSFQSAGMMQYLKGVSYRAIHDGKCYAVEQLQTGSSYRDNPKSEQDIPDTVLQQHYDDLKAVVESFRFATS